MNFSEKKSSQVAACFLQKAGEELDIMKLMKLMYLAERKHLALYAEPLTGDLPYSFEHGPMLTHSYNLSKFRGRRGDWDEVMNEREGMYVSLKATPALTHLSRANLRAIDETWAEYGHLSGPELSDFTHEKCAEWTYPGKSSIPIEYWKFLESAGYTQEQAEVISSQIEEQRLVEKRI